MAEILRTGQDAQHPWPEGSFLQGSSAGVVLHRDPDAAAAAGTATAYRTAFVEVAPAGLRTFIRGEGSTVSEAEDAAWAQYQRFIGCAAHDFEPKGYTNGAGFCKNCGLFKSKAFTALELGLFCDTCETPANYSTAGGKWFCQDHAPSRQQRRALDEAAGLKPSPLMALLDALLEEDGGATS